MLNSFLLNWLYNDQYTDDVNLIVGTHRLTFVCFQQRIKQVLENLRIKFVNQSAKFGYSQAHDYG